MVMAGPPLERLSVAFWRLRGVLPMLAATRFPTRALENDPVVTRTKSMAIENYAASISFEFFEHFLEGRYRLGETRAQSQGLVAVTGA